MGRRVPVSTLICSEVSTYPPWTFSDVPTSGSILNYSHFVQTVQSLTLFGSMALNLCRFLLLDVPNLPTGLRDGMRAVRMQVYYWWRPLSFFVEPEMRHTFLGIATLAQAKY